MSKDIEFIKLPADSHKNIRGNISFKPFFPGLLFPFSTCIANPVLEKSMGASLIGGFSAVILSIAFLVIFIKLSKSTERISFLPGSYQALHEGICYKIDPNSDNVEMTQKLNFKYSPEESKKATNLINELGAEEIQKRTKLFSKFFLFLILLFIFLMICPILFSGKSSDFLFAGKILTVIMGIALLIQIGDYNSAMEYYKDSYCKKCGKHFTLEEVQVPLMKEESRTDTYTKTLTRYWRCKSCGFNDTKVEPQHVNHRYEKKLHKLKGDECKQCGREDALEEYRIADVVRDSDSVNKSRYYRCRYCGYHEIKVEVEVYTD